MRTSDAKVTHRFTPTGVENSTVLKVTSITFPDKKSITLFYSPSIKYNASDYVIDRIKISDSIVRYGYRFDWNCCNGTTITGARNYLNKIIFFTSTGAKDLYTFYYSTTRWLPAYGSAQDTLSNQRDHWGFYNAQVTNGSNAIPTISGLFNGAIRDPSIPFQLAGSLEKIISPSGAYTYYYFEPNDVFQYNTVNQTVAINANNNTSNNISLSQVYSNQYNFTVAFDNSFSRTGSPPFSGSCMLTYKITSTDGLATYKNDSISLFQLFYVGSAGFSFSVPGNGNYKLVTSLGNCTGTPPSLPVNFTWQNQVIVSNAATSGGIRIKYIVHYDPTLNRSDTIASYKYLTPEGRSSGFLSAVPQYTYPYQETVINGGTTVTNYTAISSDPVNTLNYSQGSPVGYSRVIEYKGSPTHNLGNTVYEFTNLQDAGMNVGSPSFPYAPQTQPDWALGLPKRIAVYDSLGHLVKITKNTYTITPAYYTSSDFTSLKLGKSSVTFNGDPNSPSTPYTEYYTGQLYFPQSGRTDLSSTIDSIYHPDGSIQVTEQDFQYDTNYNVIKVTSPYDKTRGLSLEKRLYYPYNYTLSSGAIKKMKDSSIISPVISAETWITGDANPRIIDARITDYQQLAKGHLKPLTSYALQSNAPVNQSVIGVFNPASLVRNSTYLIAQQNYPTYDTMGNLLEVKNAISGQSNSVIMDYYNQFPVAKVSNATPANTAYTSFESDGNGNWTVASKGRNYQYALTGKKSYALDSGNITKTGLSSSLVYIISYWCRTGASVSVSGAQNIKQVAQQNGWNLYTMTISSATSVTVSGTGVIDELRLYPKDANMATSTFEPLLGVTSTCDPTNITAYYLYDNINRVKVLKDKDLNVVKKFDYGDTASRITLDTIWHATGNYQCMPTGGAVYREEKDINTWSETYGSLRYLFDHTDCVACPPACGGQGQKVINCVCEMGTRVNISSVHMKVNNVWIYRCTYYYYWSDCSQSINYTEDNANPCTVGGGCEIE